MRTAQGGELPPDELLSLLRQMDAAHLGAVCAAVDGLLTQATCPEAQADGVPCPSAADACDQCARARAVFATVQRRVGLP